MIFKTNKTTFTLSTIINIYE